MDRSLALLVVVGGVFVILGVAVGVPLMSALRRLAPEGVPFVAAMTLNIPALAAAAALTLGSVVLFGILPAVAGSRQSPVTAMREGSAGTGAGTATVRLRDALVVAEMAMAVVLMVCAGLLIRSFTKITSAPTTNSEIVCPRPQNPPMIDAVSTFLCSLTIVETAIR